MARPLFRVQGAFSAVAAGGTATNDIAVGDKYHQFRIAYGTATAGGPTQVNMEAEIDEIRIKVNGRVQRVMSAAQLFAINAYHGIAFTAGFLPILLTESWKRTVLGEDLPAWGTADVQTLQIEVDINGGATTPVLSMTAIAEKVEQPMGPIVKWKRFQVPAAAVGVLDFHQFPRTDAYHAIHNFSADIDDILVKIDGADEFDALLADANEYYAQQGFTGQANMFHIDFQARSRTNDALSMVRANRRVADFRVEFNMSAGTPFTALTETLGFRD